MADTEKVADKTLDDAESFVKEIDDVHEGKGKNADEVLDNSNKADKVKEDEFNKLSDEPHSNNPHVEKYFDDLVNDAGEVSASKMRDVRLAVQRGEFSVDEIHQISTRMSGLGITSEFEDEMKKLDFGKYLRNTIGNPPR